MEKEKKDDSTIVLTDINEALSASEKEASSRPAALLVVGGDLNGTIFDLNKPQITIGKTGRQCHPLGISRNFPLSLPLDRGQ